MGHRRDASDTGGIPVKMGAPQANRDGINCIMLLNCVSRSTQRCRIELRVRVANERGMEDIRTVDGVCRANRDGLSCIMLFNCVPRSTQRCRIELWVRVGGQDGQDEKVLGGEF